jgi:pyruvate kinase
VCHLYDLLRRGYAGIVLSDETAVGAHPVHAVRTVASLMRDLSG